MSIYIIFAPFFNELLHISPFPFFFRFLNCFSSATHTPLEEWREFMRQTFPDVVSLTSRDSKALTQTLHFHNVSRYHRSTKTFHLIKTCICYADFCCERIRLLILTVTKMMDGRMDQLLITWLYNWPWCVKLAEDGFTLSGAGAGLYWLAVPAHYIKCLLRPVVRDFQLLWYLTVWKPEETKRWSTITSLLCFCGQNERGCSTAALLSPTVHVMYLCLGGRLPVSALT